MAEFAEAGLRAVGLLAGVNLKMIAGFKIDFLYINQPQHFSEHWLREFLLCNVHTLLLRI